MALLDATTGDLRCGEVADDARLAEELRRAGVRELLLPRAAAGAPRGAELARAVGAPLAEVDDGAFERGQERPSPARDGPMAREPAGPSLSLPSTE